jgi:hypothetical protein
MPLMPYEFTPWETEPETLASSSRSGGPPRKTTGIGVLDPPVPPRRPVGPIPQIPASLVLRIFAVLLLVAIGIALFLMLFPVG